MPQRVGIDTGGTFTDVCLLGEDGSLAIFKLSSTVRDPSEAIATGLTSILDDVGSEPKSVGYLGHGTTVATNALLEHRGAKTGVITTTGFRDLLELGRQMRPDLYDLQADKPAPLVRRAHRLEVDERVLATGEVLQPIDREATRRAVHELKQAGVQSIAVCFLYSYVLPDHEDLVAEIIRDEFPDVYVSLSHDVIAEFREYERLSTTVVNSYVGPLMSRYIRRLRTRLTEIGVPAAPFITQSNGGIISLDAASETPVRTVLSGPAAGVIGARTVADAAGIHDIITFDMGGTSTDISLITTGQGSIRMQQEVAGYPIRTPMLDISTVGAGGGSIAWIDSGGHLKVGPQSAGADPGPACYGLGGEDATVTDANVVLGILSGEALLGGRMPIDAAKAVAAVDRLSAILGLARDEVAQGIISLATANMARAIRVISVERGYDPRDYTLVAFGGAGPLHASRLARELDIPRILVPTIPGILCAYGLLVADLRTDFSRTIVLPAVAESLSSVNLAFEELTASATGWFDREGIPYERRHVTRQIDMRYAGQNYELPIEVPDRDIDENELAAVIRSFHEAHDRAYGYAAEDEPAQFVTLRLIATGVIDKPEPRRVPSSGSVEEAKIGLRRSYLPEQGGWGDVPLYSRAALPAGARFSGPAIIEQMDSTTLVLPGQHVDVDEFGNLIITDEH